MLVPEQLTSKIYLKEESYSETITNGKDKHHLAGPRPGACSPFGVIFGDFLDRAVEVIEFVVGGGVEVRKEPLREYRRNRRVSKMQIDGRAADRRRRCVFESKIRRPGKSSAARTCPQDI